MTPTSSPIAKYPAAARVRRWGLPTLAAVVALSLVGWWVVAGRTDPSRTEVTAVFADSSPLIPGNKVQLNGVEVGAISRIDLVAGHAHVRMSLNRSVLPLHTDATAQIQPVSLLGERFIALTQGSPSAPVLSDPVVIPVERTSSSVDLDQLLNTLDDPTSTALAAMVTTLGEGVAEQGGNVAEGLRALAPTLRQTDQLSRLLDQQNAVLDRLIVQARRNGVAFAEPMDSLVDSAERTLGTVAANREAMNDSLLELPSTLSSAQRSLDQLGATADRATEMLADVRPLTDDLAHTSRELHEFADAARPALSSMPDVLDKLNQMLDDARPVVDELRPLSGDLSTVSNTVRVLNDQLFTHAPGVPSQLENLMTGVANWSMATSGYDGLSHYFRAVVMALPSTLANAGVGALPPVLPGNPVNPVPPDPNGPHRPGSPALPFMPSLPNPDGPDNGSSTTPEDAPRTAPRSDSASASGLSSKQEAGMFDQLLGGGR
jgi:phospholipid/cholesterol/gamma-HCH transport system substrate-binding protein